MSGSDNSNINKINRAQTSEVTDWFARLRAQEVDAELDEEFRQWLAEDPAHEQEYQQCELVWELSGDLEEDSGLLKDFSEADKLIAQNDTSQTSIFARWGKPMAIAASLCTVAVTALLITFSPTPEPYVTAIGEQRLVKLKDGSTIALNTDTELSVSYSESERRIELTRGEALFTVENSPVPFIVYAASGKAQVLGTRFNVRLKDKGATVSVLEGIVQVESAPSLSLDQPTLPPRLTAGQAVNYWKDGAISNIRKADINRIEAWRAGKLSFDSTRLEDVLAEHNRYTNHKILVGDDELKDEEVSGVFRVGENEPLIFALENAFNIRAIDQGKVTILLSKSNRSNLPTQN